MPRRAKLLTLDVVPLIAGATGIRTILGEWIWFKHLLGGMTYPSAAHLG